MQSCVRVLRWRVEGGSGVARAGSGSGVALMLWLITVLHVFLRAMFSVLFTDSAIYE
jgi:hypothetical protein